MVKAAEESNNMEGARRLGVEESNIEEDGAKSSGKYSNTASLSASPGFFNKDFFRKLFVQDFTVVKSWRTKKVNFLNFKDRNGHS